MTSREDPIKSEISVRELWDVLLRYKYLVFGLPAILAVVAAALVLKVRPQWEAIAIVQLGQVWQVAAPIEAPNRAVERMKFRPFQEGVLKSIGISAAEASDFSVVFTSSMKIRVLPNTDLLELKVRAYSRDEAKRWAEASVKHLQLVHQKLAEPSIARLQSQFAELKRQVKEIRDERDRFLKNAELKSEIGPGNRFAENLILSNYLVQKDAELRALESQRLALQEQLDPAKTYPTSLIESVYVPEKRAYPKRTLVVLLAGFVGLIIGVIGAFILNAIRANRAA